MTINEKAAQRTLSGGDERTAGKPRVLAHSSTEAGAMQEIHLVYLEIFKWPMTEDAEIKEMRAEAVGAANYEPL